MGRKKNGTAVQSRPKCRNCKGTGKVQVPREPPANPDGIWDAARSGMKTIDCPNCSGTGDA